MIEIPVVEMWRACLARAIQDLLGVVGMTSHKKEIPHVQHEALQFLTATSGEWYRSRVDICTIVDVDPDALRERIVAILEGDAECPPFSHARADSKRVEQARELWRRHKDNTQRAQEVRLERANNPPPPLPEPRLTPQRAPLELRYSVLRRELFKLMREIPGLKFKDFFFHWD